MIAWFRWQFMPALHWQLTCLADTIRYAWRRAWYGKPGRHGGWHDYTNAELDAIEADLAYRPRYALEPAPALSSLPAQLGHRDGQAESTFPPAPGPELFHHEDWGDTLNRIKLELREDNEQLADTGHQWEIEWALQREAVAADVAAFISAQEADVTRYLAEMAADLDSSAVALSAAA